MRKFSFGFVMALFVMLFSAQAFANPESGFDIRFGIGVPSVIQNFSIDSDYGSIESPDLNNVGYGFNLSLGYRWEYFGVYVDQDLAHIFLVGDIGEGKASDMEMKYRQRFLGATYLMVRGFFDINDSLLFLGGVGFGVMYGGGADAESDSNNRVFLTKDEEGKGGDVGFGFKAQLGITYFLNDFMGIGFNLDYALGYKSIDLDGAKLNQYVHVITPALHFNINI